jgi:hypothetical protein
MQNTTITEPVKQTASYIQIAPVMEAIRLANDKRPKSSLPSETEGTVQENAPNIPPVTLYNAHGIVRKENPNSLIGYA